jgi:hypothetical protein
MEVFVARSFGRRIVPIMVKDCFGDLDKHEETKGLGDIFMMRMYRLNAVGLPISGREAFHRLACSLTASMPKIEAQVYISYPNYHGEFATLLARSLEKRRIKTWVATRDIHLGENWRDAQARAMLRAFAHVVVLSADMFESHVLRTEILLGEARGLPVFTVLPPEITNPDSRPVKTMLRRLNSSDLTYRRLVAMQHFLAARGLKSTADGLARCLSAVAP